MKISLKRWIIFGLLALISLGIWYKLEYPRLSFIDLSLDKKEAVARARSYLSAIGVGQKDYLTAVTFYTDDWTDRYLQRTLGLEAKKFIQEHKLELFAWQIRFFKENQKEEYVLRISAQSGEVLAFSHLIEDIEARDTPDKATAERQAKDFLRSYYGLRRVDYEFNSQWAERLDQRRTQRMR